MLNSSQEYKEQLVNELIRLTSVASVPVISQALTVPPTSQLTPDSYYIVPSGATGAWAGKTNQIAYPIIGVNGQPNGDWGFWLPFPGVKVFLVSGGDLFFDGTDWQFTSVGGDMFIAEYGGSDAGIVAKADEIAGNPSNNTFYGKESGNKGFFEFFPKVLTTVLTGLSTATGGVITATDNILQAFGKLQNQISNLQNQISNLQNECSTASIFGLFESPKAGSWMIEYVLVKAYNITSISLKTDSGTATVSIQINGINVQGLSNLNVTSTRLTATASGSNTASIGSEVKIFISNISNPVNLDFSLSIQYA